MKWDYDKCKKKCIHSEYYKPDKYIQDGIEVKTDKEGICSLCYFGNHHFKYEEVISISDEEEGSCIQLCKYCLIKALNKFDNK